MTHPTAIENHVTDASVQERAGVYLLFARLFREAPTAELLRQLVEHRWLTAAEQWADAERSLDPVEGASWPKQSEAIAIEFARLFVVPGEQAVRPYESVYTDTLTIDTSTACSPYFDPEPTAGGLTGFLHGASANAVRDAYQHAGFSVEPGSHELPDHLAIELEFMGQLLARGKTNEARAFLTAHLGRWIFRCLEDIQQRASPFYRAVAKSLANFLRHEAPTVRLSRLP